MSDYEKFVEMIEGFGIKAIEDVNGNTRRVSFVPDDVDTVTTTKVHGSGMVVSVWVFDTEGNFQHIDHYE